jgi:PD-(D/E)XK nuclease superfamily
VANRSKTRPRAPRVSKEGSESVGDRSWILSPSDFAFLWDDCPRCFYLKVARNEERPRSPFPSVFGKIDRAMKCYYLGERAEDLAPGMPAGVVSWGDRWVKSAPLPVPGSSRPRLIRGRVDVLVDCDDRSTGIVDFKTTVPKSDHLATYGRQLHAYAMALEHPSSGPAVEVSSLGLLCFLPELYEAEGAQAALCGRVQWIEVPRDDQAFVSFLGEVVSVLEAGNPPAPDPTCQWCRLRDHIGAAA